MTNKNLSYIQQPCDRCGSKRVESKPKSESIKTTFGSSAVEITVVICTNVECQQSFEEQRAKDLVVINARKLERENRNKERQANISKSIANKREFKIGKKRE